MQAGGLLLAACLLATAASAQTAAARGLAPRSPTSRTRHVVRLGYRESSPPFSFLDQANRPIGYSLELCEAIVDEIGVEVDDPNLKIEYVKVTSDDRIPAVMQNKIDLECGSTTANAERAKQVAFSPLMFVAGTKLMVPKASSDQSAPTDLKGKTVVVTKGTTNEQAMHNADKKFSLGLNIVTSPDHEQSYQMLVDGKADAFATDDILLYGLIARHKSQDKFQRHRRLSVLRSLRHHVPQGRAATGGGGRAHLPQARLQPRPDSALQQMVRARGCRPASGSTSRSRRSSRKPSRCSTIRRRREQLRSATDTLVQCATIACVPQSGCTAELRLHPEHLDPAPPHTSRAPAPDGCLPSASIITPELISSTLPARRRPARRRSTRSGCRSRRGPDRASPTQASRASPCSSRTGVAPESRFAASPRCASCCRRCSASIIEQDHAHFVLDLDIRAKSQGSDARRKSRFTARSSCGLRVDTRNTDRPDVPSLGLTTRPCGMLRRAGASIASPRSRSGRRACSSFGLRNSVCGMQAMPAMLPALPRSPPCRWRSDAPPRCSARGRSRTRSAAALATLHDDQPAPRSHLDRDIACRAQYRSDRIHEYSLAVEHR